MYNKYYLIIPFHPIDYCILHDTMLASYKSLVLLFPSTVVLIQGKSAPPPGGCLTMFGDIVDCHSAGAKMLLASNG